MRRTLLAALVCFVTACDESEPSVPVQNQCIDDDSCAALRDGRGSPPRCDRSIGACVLEKTAESYELFLRVRATTEGSMLADAGVSLVPETVTSLGSLVEGRDAEIVRIQQALSVPGSVTTVDDGGLTLVESQVVIRARDAMVPLTSSVFQLEHITPPRDGGRPALTALLDPEEEYDVQVQPLLGDAYLPPVRFDLLKPFSFLYDDALTETRTGTLIFREQAPPPDAGSEEKPKPHPLQVRLEDKVTGEVLSSSVMVEVSPDDPRQGTFTVRAPRDVFASQNFNLVIGLADFPPWQVTISIDGARFLSGPEIFLPAIPMTVIRAGRVEHIDERGKTQPLPLVDVEFVSRYIPSDAGTSGGPDWCQWGLDPARLSCAGHFQSTSNDAGDWRVELLPGQYDVVALPRPEEPTAAGLIASLTSYLVLQAGEGDRFVVDTGKPYTGTISAGGIAAPQVTLRAVRRPTPPFSSWGPVANFNRSTEAISDRNGHVKLLPDVGYYDFIMDPGDESGLPWKLWLDCPNGPGAGGALRPLTISAPVMVSGVVQYEDSGVPLRAQIEAFTVVEKHTNGTTRSVMIGRTQTDEDGLFRLALPPRVGENDRQNLCESSALTDSAP